MYPVGRGFRIANKPRGAKSPRYFDLERMREFEFGFDPLPVIRRGIWVARTEGRRAPGDRSRWRLFDPETEAFAPLRGLEEGDKLGPLIDDRRFVAYTAGKQALWLLDPESGERTRLRLPPLEGGGLLSAGHPAGSWGGARTPSGAPIVQLRFDTARQTCLAVIVNDELVCTPPVNGLLELVACPGDDTVLAVVERRTLERLRFGSTEREVLFPR